VPLERRDDGRAGSIVLVTEKAMTKRVFSEMFEPERRADAASRDVNVKVDALIEELHQVGVLGDELSHGFTQKVLPCRLFALREFEPRG